MKRVLFSILLLMLAGFSAGIANAQDATPSTGECTVAPRSQAQIDELAAQAAALPESEAVDDTEIDLSQGESIDDATRAALNQVLLQIQLCSQKQDLARLLALYTDRFIVEQFFASEPVTIVETDQGTPLSATPAPLMTDQEQFVMNAVYLPDGRIAAAMSSNAWGGYPQGVIFVQENGHWLIDVMGPVAGGTGAVVIPEAARTVVDEVIHDATMHFDVDPATFWVSLFEPVEWPDASLGCPQDNGVYAQVVSPGYRIVITDGAMEFEYHTGPDDVFVRCHSQL